MENASKALIMAAEILIGVMIISIGVYLFQMFANYSEENYKKISDTQIAEFNNRFFKFHGKTINSEGETVSLKCTIHDIVSLANYAQQHNKQYEIEEEGGFSENSLYVQIDLEGVRNLEKRENSYLVDLIKQNSLIDGTSSTKYYECTVCSVNENTQMVNYVVFREIY